MTRRWLLILGFILLIAFPIVAWYEPDGRVKGWLRGEAFFAGRSTGYWVKQLSEDDPQAQNEALWELREGKAQANEVLREILTNSTLSCEVRSQAAVLIGYQGAKGASETAALLSVLERDDDPSLQAIVVRALADVAPNDDAVIVQLVPLLEGPQRLTTLTVLTRTAAGGPEMVQALTKVVEENREAAEVALAIEALALRKSLARGATNRVREAIKQEDPVVRRFAAEALGKIALPDEEVILALVGGLSDDDAGVREASARSLGWFGSAARSTVPSLRKLLDDESKEVRSRAAQALRRIDTQTQP